MIRRNVGVIAAAVVFVLCIAVIIVAQQQTSWGNLAAMLAALAGLIVLLALYNRRYR